MAEKRAIGKRWQIVSTEKLNEAVASYLSTLDLPTPYSAFVRECVRKELIRQGYDLNPEDVQP